MVKDLDKWVKAGRIAAEVREYGKSLVKPGVMLLDVAEKIEAKIAELGAQPAFPVNISLNDAAAHYTAMPDDDIVFKDELVKIDVGVHIDGCIGDTACTVDLSGKNTELVKASEEALKNAIKMIKPGVSVSDIGKTIKETITSYGFSPVVNLSGHGLEKYEIHAAPGIPNYDTREKEVLKKGQIIAIEPFATAGKGQIYESGNAVIFCQIARKPVRSQFAREILRDIEEYKNLPFALRWLVKKHSLPKVRFALRELIQAGIIKEYPPLVDMAHGLVSQAEHTILVDDKVTILTE